MLFLMLLLKPVVDAVSDVAVEAIVVVHFVFCIVLCCGMVSCTMCWCILLLCILCSALFCVVEWFPAPCVGAYCCCAVLFEVSGWSI